MSEVIIGVTPEDKLREEQYKMVAVNALKTMSEILVEMEVSGMKSEEMMRFCVWPILEECKDRFEKISNGENVKVDGFEKIFDKRFK